MPAEPDGGGVGPLQIEQVIGVIKAYSTRVGKGPFPTRDDESVPSAGEGARVEHDDRPRPPLRLVHAVPLRYAVAVNSASSLMLNKLDILSGLEQLRIATS